MRVAINTMKITLMIRRRVNKNVLLMMMRIATQQWRNLISEGVVAGPQMFDEKQICGARPEIFTTMGSSS